MQYLYSALKSEDAEALVASCKTAVRTVDGSQCCLVLVTW